MHKGTQTPTVSIIIPTYNRAHLIGEALESVFAQTYLDYEVIVVDDGSTDDTREVLKSYGKRIRVVYQENQGISAARNRGISVSMGCYIAFLDSDDVWLPEKLERQVSYLDQHPAVALLYSRMRYTYVEKQGRERIVPEKAFVTVEELLSESNCIPTSCAVVRKDSLDKVGLFDPALPIAEDFDLWLRIGRRYEIGFQDEILGEHRRHALNTTENLEKVYRGYWKLYEKVVKEFGSKLRNRRDIEQREAKFRYLLGAHLFKSGRSKEAVGLIAGALRQNGHLGTLFAKEGDPVWKKLFLSVKPYAVFLASVVVALLPSRKAVILIADSSSGVGGSAKYLSDLLTSLKEEEFAFELLVYRQGPFFERIAETGIPLRYVSFLRYPWFEQRENLPYLLKALLTAVQFSVTVPWLCIFLLKRRVAVVHLNNEISSHIPLILACWITRRRIFCQLHGWRSLTRLEKAVAGFVHMYVGITRRGTLFYQKEYPAGRYVTIPNGIRFKEKESASDRLATRKKLGIENGSVCLGMIGRLIPLKGQAVFLETFKELLTAAPEARALIVGGDGASNGAYLKGLQEQARRLGIQDKVHFTGWQKDVEPYLAAMDIVIHPSIDPESFGLVIAEAMEQRKPVVATNVGGVPELIQDHVNGLLVPPNDSQGLSQALLELIQHPELAARLAQAGQESVVKRFDIRQNARKMARIYRVFLGQRALFQGRSSEDR